MNRLLEQVAENSLLPFSELSIFDESEINELMNDFMEDL